MISMIWPERLRAQSPAYAKRFTDALFARVSTLENFPQAGRVVPEKADGTIRELVHRHYRIVYRIVTATQVDIVSVQATNRPLTGI